MRRTTRQSTSTRNATIIAAVIVIMGAVMGGSTAVYSQGNPVVTGIDPNAGTNDVAGPIMSVVITGSDFSSPMVWMEGPGGTMNLNITGSDGNTIHADASLRGQVTGVWDVVVRNSDGSIGRLDGAFTIFFSEALSCQDWGWVRFRGPEGRTSLIDGPYTGCEDCEADGSACKFCTYVPDNLNPYGPRDIACNTCSTCTSETSIRTCRVSGNACSSNADCDMDDNPDNVCSVRCNACADCAEYGVNFSAENQKFYGYAWSGGGSIPVSSYTSGRISAEEGLGDIGDPDYYDGNAAAPAGDFKKCETTRDGCSCDPATCTTWGWTAASADLNVRCYSAQALVWDLPSMDRRRASRGDVEGWGYCAVDNGEWIRYALPADLPGTIAEYYVNIGEYSETPNALGDERDLARERLEIRSIDSDGSTVLGSTVVGDLNTSVRLESKSCTTGQKVPMRSGGFIEFRGVGAREVKIDWFEISSFRGTDRICESARLEAEYGVGSIGLYINDEARDCERRVEGCDRTSGQALEDEGWFAQSRASVSGLSYRKYVRDRDEASEEYLTEPDGWGAIRLADASSFFDFNTGDSSTLPYNEVLAPGPAYVTVRAGFDAAELNEGFSIVHNGTTQSSADLTTDSSLGYNEWVTCTFRDPIDLGAGDTVRIANAGNADVDIDWIEFSSRMPDRGRTCDDGHVFGLSEAYNTGRIQFETGFGAGPYETIDVDNYCDIHVDTNDPVTKWCACKSYTWPADYRSPSYCTTMGVEIPRNDWSAKWGIGSSHVDIQTEFPGQLPNEFWDFGNCLERNGNLRLLCSEDSDCTNGPLDRCVFNDQYNPPGICARPCTVDANCGTGTCVNPPAGYCQQDTIDQARDVCYTSGEPDCPKVGGVDQLCVSNPYATQQHVVWPVPLEADIYEFYSRDAGCTAWPRFADCDKVANPDVCKAGVRAGELCSSALDCPIESLVGQSGFGECNLSTYIKPEGTQGDVTPIRWKEVSVPDGIVPGQYFINFGARYSDSFGGTEEKREWLGVLVRDGQDGGLKQRFHIADLIDPNEDTIEQCSIGVPANLEPGDVLRFTILNNPDRFGDSVSMDWWQLTTFPLFNRECETKISVDYTAYSPEAGEGWIAFDPPYGGVQAIQAWVQTKFGDIYSRTGVGRPEGGAGEAPSSLNLYNAMYLIETHGNDIFWTSEDPNLLRTGGSELSIPTPAQPDTPLGSLDIEELKALTDNIYTPNVKRISAGTGNWSTDADNCFLQSNQPLLGRSICIFEGDLTIDEAIQIKNGSLDGQYGAGTIIVEGNLLINSDIAYQTTTVDLLEKLASVAWVVQGDIIISPSVHTIVGAFIALNDFTTGEGSTVSTGQGMETLTVHGLMMAHQFVFERTSAITTEPSEVVVYDGRIIANPPPGTQEIANLLPTTIEVFPETITSP